MTKKLAYWIVGVLGTLVASFVGWTAKDTVDNAKQVPVIVLEVTDVKNQNDRYEDLFQDAINRDERLKTKIDSLERQVLILQIKTK